MHPYVKTIQPLYIMMMQIPMHESTDLDYIYILKRVERIWVRNSGHAVPNKGHSISIIITLKREAAGHGLTPPTSFTFVPHLSVAGAISRRAGMQSSSP